MTKTILTFIALLVSSVSVSYAQVKSYALNVKEFHSLEVVDGINVDYECNPEKAGTVEFETTPELVSSIIFEPNKGKLSVKLASSEHPYKNLPTVRVYSSFLSKVENSGDSTVRVLASAGLPEFSARVIGNGRMVVRNVRATEIKASLSTGHGTLVIYGKCDHASLSCLGGASFLQADDLEADDVKCSVNGTGTINCYALNNLNVSGIGSGKVYYRGNPVIKKSKLSNIKYEPIN